MRRTRARLAETPREQDQNRSKDEHDDSEGAAEYYAGRHDDGLEHHGVLAGHQMVMVEGEPEAQFGPQSSWTFNPGFEDQHVAALERAILSEAFFFDQANDRKFRAKRRGYSDSDR